MINLLFLDEEKLLEFNIIIAIIIFLFIIIIVAKNLKLVRKNHVYIVERLGTYKESWTNGFIF